MTEEEKVEKVFVLSSPDFKERRLIRRLFKREFQDGFFEEIDISTEEGARRARELGLKPAPAVYAIVGGKARECELKKDERGYFIYCDDQKPS